MSIPLVTRDDRTHFGLKLLTLGTFITNCNFPFQSVTLTIILHTGNAILPWAREPGEERNLH